MYFTGVGSRETPYEVCQWMGSLSYSLTKVGHVLRSGGAVGADAAFQMGVDPTKSRERSMEIYLPYNRFQGWVEGPGIINAQNLPNLPKAIQLASEVHPAWHRVKPQHQVLHGRNAFQVLGGDLNTPATVVILWAPPVGKNGAVKGGTNTAYQIAMRHDIPVINLYNFNDLKPIWDEIEKYTGYNPGINWL